MWTVTYVAQQSSTGKAASDTVVVTVVAAVPATSTSVTLLSPNGGETLTVGQPYTVRWSSQNLPAGYGTAILLYQGTTMVKILAKDLDNSFTSWPVTIPSTVSPGQYSIRLFVSVSTGVTYSDYSDALVTVVSGQTSQVNSSLAAVANTLDSISLVLKQLMQLIGQ